MSVAGCVSRFRVCVALCALLLGGCVDHSLAPRAYDINQGTQNVRESAILLNIVRASRSEPLNFVALAKYTGTGSMSLNEALIKNYPARAPANTVLGQIFTSSVGAVQSNSFDVGTLETKEFYGGFMSPLDLEGLNLLMNAGLSKELVLHSVLHGFRVRLSGKSLLFVNNPDDDVAWNGIPCSTLYDGTEHAFEPLAASGVWRDPAVCKYQKFLYFLRVAVRWGVTVEAAAPVVRARGAKGGKGAASSGEGPRIQYFVCYDPAVALENGMRAANPDAPEACGSKN